MSSLNPLNDLSKIYLDTVAKAHKEEGESEVKRWEGYLNKEQKDTPDQVAAVIDMYRSKKGTDAATYDSMHGKKKEAKKERDYAKFERDKMARDAQKSGHRFLHAKGSTTEKEGKKSIPMKKVQDSYEYSSTKFAHLMDAYQSVYNEQKAETPAAEEEKMKKDDDLFGSPNKKKKKKHHCASKVKHEQFGIGNCIKGMHDLDENGVVQHYDVFFEHGIEKNVPVTSLKIIDEAMHEHVIYDMDEQKMADKDYDGDGKVESGTDEYMGSRDKAIKKAMGKKKSPESIEAKRRKDDDLAGSPMKEAMMAKKYQKGGMVKGYQKGGEVKVYQKGGMVKGYQKGGMVSKEEVEVDEAMSSYDKARKAAARRAADRNAARRRGEMGGRMERETYTNEAGRQMHHKGYRAEEAEVDEAMMSMKGYQKGGMVKKYQKGGMVKGYQKGGMVKGYQKGGMVSKEELSNWRDDLIEVSDTVGSGGVPLTDVEAGKKVKEGKVNNKVVINPKLGEAIEQMGGELIEVQEEMNPKKKKKGDQLEVAMEKGKQAIGTLGATTKGTSYAEEDEKFIQKAIKRPGAFTRKAKAAGMSVQQFAKNVDDNPDKYSTRTKRQANLAQTLTKLSKEDVEELFYTLITE